jgi:DNA-binding transcriptional LysR family regulator
MRDRAPEGPPDARMEGRIAWTASGLGPSVQAMESGIEIRQLRAFVALVEHGSVTAAAQRLNLAQSTVSEALSSLERALGTPVFLRRRAQHDLMLTDAGQALLPHARAVLDTLGAAHVAVAHATSGARARISIGTNESVSSYVLSPSLISMRRSWPNVTFAVTVAVCNAIRAGVEAGEYDLGLGLYPHADDTLFPQIDRTVVANEVPLVIFASPSHPLAADRATPVPRDALVSYPLFITDAAGDFHSLVRRFLENDGLPGPHLQATGSVEGVKRAVLGDSSALGMLPAYALLDDMRTGRVVSLALRPPSPQMRLEAMMARSRHQHPAACQLVEAVRASFRGM